MKQMWFSGRSNGGGHEAVGDEEQAFHLAFRAMGKDLDGITIKDHKILHAPL